MAIGLALKFWTKSLNFALCGFSILLFVLLNHTFHISTNLLSFLPDGKGKEVFGIYTHFKKSREILIASEGFNEASLAQIKAIETKLTASNLLKLESAIAINPTLIHYTKANAFYLKELTPNPTVEIEKRVQELYDTMLNNPYYTAIDANDPLGYFTPREKPMSITIRDGHVALGDFGYFAVFSIQDTSNTIESYKTVYEFIHKELAGMSAIRLFSPTFYFVENSQKIESDINFLVVLSTISLLILYLVLIRNLLLLLNTIATLTTSTLLSFLLIGMLWSDVSVFVLAFGNAIGALAIDYMFLHYFCGHYENKKPFNRSVFYGFLATFGSFCAFSWINFPLIQQVCLFAMISLVLSYLQFAFLFPRIQFKEARPFVNKQWGIAFPYKAIMFTSIVLIVGALYTLHIDTDIKSLDYQNRALMGEEQFFKRAIKKEGFTPILIEASSVDELIAKSNLIKNNFSKATVPLAYFIDKASFEKRKEALKALHLEQKRELIEAAATKAGFREGFFKNAYSPEMLYPEHRSFDMETLNTMGFEIVQKGGKYFTYALIQSHETSLLEKYPFAFSIDAKEMFFNVLQKITHELLISGFLSLGLSAVILFFVCRHTLAMSASYALLPAALILLLLGAHFTIIHIFMLFILISFGVDYGIYMRHANSLEKETISAIVASLISAFAGFGVLVFSDIGALHTMGLVSCIGIGAILVLLMGKK